MLSRKDFTIKHDKVWWYDWDGDSFKDPLLPQRIVSEMLGREVVLVDEKHAGNGHFSARIQI